jgi:amidohydrolase
LSADLMSKVMEIKDYITGIRRQIHQHPEVGFKEAQTTKLIIKELESYGIEVVPLSTETGVLGVLKGKKRGGNSSRVTALRADIDALPIEEQTGVPWASTNPGVMHACGHDGHTAVLLGVAKILSSMRDQFSGTVKFIFQPAEEKLDGAKSIIKAGVLENPKPDCIVALHGGIEAPVGSIGLYPGSFMASADIFKIKLIGVGAHGAYPHRGKDVILAASQVIGGLNFIVSREIDAVEKTVLSVCQIHGGSAFNIIPQEVELSGNIRCHNKDVRASMEERVERIVSNIAEAFGCTYELEYQYGIPQVYNDEQITAEIAAAAKSVLGDDKVVNLTRPLMGSEDFSFFLEHVPGAMFRLGIADENKLQLHNPKFDFPDHALPVGIAVLTKFVLNKNQ